MKVRRIDFLICILYYAMFKIQILPRPVQQVTKIAAILIVCVFLVSKLNLKHFVNISVPFSLAVIVSGIYAYFRGLNTLSSMMDGVLFAIIIYCVYTLCAYCKRKNKADRFIDCFYFMSLIYSICSILTICVIGVSDRKSLMYFMGNKFSTSYLFIMFTALFAVKYYSKIARFARYKVIYVILALAAMFFSYYLNCSTAVVASLALFLALVPDSFKNILKNRYTAIIAMVMAAVILLYFETLLANPRIQYIVSNILGESSTLTGRTHIYSYLAQVIRRSPWLGYGYGNSAIRSILGYGNAQNGFFYMVINYGFVGTAILIATIFRCFKGMTEDRYFGLYVLAYAMILASIVEISYNYMFFFAVFSIAAISEKNSYRQLIKKRKKKKRGHISLKW